MRKILVVTFLGAIVTAQQFKGSHISKRELPPAHITLENINKVRRHQKRSANPQFVVRPQQYHGPNSVVSQSYQPQISQSYGLPLVPHQSQGYSPVQSQSYRPTISPSYGVPSRIYGVPSYSQSYRPNSVFTNSYQQPVRSYTPSSVAPYSPSVAFTPSSIISVTPGSVISHYHGHSSPQSPPYRPSISHSYRAPSRQHQPQILTSVHSQSYIPTISGSYGAPSQTYGVPLYSQSYRPNSFSNHLVSQPYSRSRFRSSSSLRIRKRSANPQYSVIPRQSHGQISVHSQSYQPSISKSYGVPSRNYGAPSHSQSYRPTSVITSSYRHPRQSFTPSSIISVTPGSVISQPSRVASRLTQGYRAQPLVSQPYGSGVSNSLVSQSYRRSPYRTSSFLAPRIIPGRYYSSSTINCLDKILFMSVIVSSFLSTY